MTNRRKKFAVVFTGLALAAVSGAALYRNLTSPEKSSSSAREERSLATHDVAMASLEAAGEGSAQSQRSRDSGVPDRGLVGTWSKTRTRQEDHQYAGDGDWKLSVTFKEDGHFVWDSKRQDDGGDAIDESLRGTYRVERGFVVTYVFDSPSRAARERLPELFAFWPGKRLGRQTFRLRDDSLVLGHDGAKLWIHLKRETDADSIR